ncbi:MULTISPECIES: hypothetical protein [Methylophaga]|jgi:hypothetical protein|uniref:hypothetical protein n=1 Tax=Methylophaga TaxID=40222 RepID=UPI000C69EB43|nr:MULTISPECIES: hypothetical protein [Methylophaga]MAX51734.1 hypothetical protein [Methylophaga sp.]WVI83992.1 hypothetical protein VSX76_09420 [Methylophaga thalassica]|tara:strand:+ start:10713 stop:11639 length:927 start_codon:yes stop_codon:yes gene_type:complete
MNNKSERLFGLTEQAIEQLESGHWGPIAHLIEQTHQNELWRPDFANFSEWMANLSETYDISRARCWRYKKAGSYYNSLRSTDDSLCELYDLPDYVSAEALEILERLERVAPAEITGNIKEQVLKGQISIRTLKQTWAAYRPALDGATNRGRGTAYFRPHVHTAVRFEAESILALSQDRAWTGSRKPARCVVLHNVKDEHNRESYDGLAMVQESLESPVDIHIFELHYKSGLGSISQLVSPEHYVDFCWLVLPDDEARPYRSTEKNSFGVIGLADGGELTVYRQAARAKHDTNEGEPFLRELLKLALRN